MCRRDTRTWTVHAHPLCQSYYGCPNGTVTKHGSTGHHSWRVMEEMVVVVEGDGGDGGGGGG